MLVGCLGVLSSMLAMFVSRHSVCLRFFMLALVVMMCRLMVVMGRCVMMCGSCVMMLAGRVLISRHVMILRNQSLLDGLSLEPIQTLCRL
jgi:hypothetical protein